MDPRIERTKAAVMEAATDLLLESGPTALTVDAVVARSGVAKSTLYRHWATRDEMLGAVFNHLAPVLPPIDPELAYEPALRQLLRMIVELMGDDRWRRILPALILLKAQHADLASLQEDLEHQQDAVFQDVLERGKGEGAIGADIDPDLAITLLVGPVMMAGLTGSTELTEAFADRVADHFLAATR